MFYDLNVFYFWGDQIIQLGQFHKYLIERTEERAQTIGRADGGADRRANGRADRRVDGRADGQLDGERTNELTDGRTDEWMDE